MIRRYTTFLWCLEILFNCRRGWVTGLQAPPFRRSSGYQPNWWMNRICGKCRCKTRHSLDYASLFSRDVYVWKQLCSSCKPPCRVLSKPLKRNRQGEYNRWPFSAFASLHFHVKHARKLKFGIEVGSPDIIIRSQKDCSQDMYGRVSLGYYIKLVSTKKNGLKVPPPHVVLGMSKLYPDSCAAFTADIDNNLRILLRNRPTSVEHLFIVPRKVQLPPSTESVSDQLIALLKNLRSSLAIMLRCPKEKSCNLDGVSLQVLAICPRTVPPVTRKDLVVALLNVAEQFRFEQKSPNSANATGQPLYEMAKLQQVYRQINEHVLMALKYFATTGTGQEEQRSKCAAYVASNVYNTLVTDLILSIPGMVPAVGISDTVLQKTLLSSTER